MKTPVEIAKEYLVLQQNLKMSVNKKRREIERRIQTIVDEYKFIEKEKDVVIRTERIQDEYHSLQKRKSNVETFLENNVHTIIDLLEQDGFVNRTEEKIHLTKKGITASNLRECHCLIFSNMVEQDMLQKMSATQLVALLSCFTNVSVNEEQKQLFPKCKDEEVQTLIKYITNGYNEYMKKEEHLHINSGIDYEIHYDLIDYVLKWCDCECIEDCKMLIQTLEAEKGIFLGEFVKALLKINNISSELENIAEQNGNIQFLHVLKQIPRLTLKYVVTNQSLYV
jgi:hypothetical protein